MARRKKNEVLGAEILNSLLSATASGVRGLEQRFNKLADRFGKEKIAPASRTAPSSRSEGRNSGNNSTIDKILEAFIGKITALLAPAAIIATILSSQASGMKVFFQAIGVLGNTLGSVLLPATMMGAAAILTLSDYIQAALIPNLGEWYTFLLTEGTNLMDLLSKSALDTADTYYHTTNLWDMAMMGMVRTISDVRLAFAGLIGVLRGLGVTGKGKPFQNDFDRQLERLEKSNRFGGNFERGMADEAARNLVKNRPSNKYGKPGERAPSLLNADGSKFNWSDNFKKNLDKSIQQFLITSFPSSQSMGIADAAKNAQMAALQMTPYEQENLRLLMIAVTELQKANEKLKPGAAQ